MADQTCSESPVWQVWSPLISLVGAILVWVGVWDFIVDYMRGGELRYDAMYMCVGTAFLFLTRTLIAQAGLKPIAYTPPPHTTQQQHSTSTSTLLSPILIFLATTYHPPNSSTAALYLRSLLALVAGIVFWLGAYNLLDLWMIESSLTRDTLYALAGLVIMFITANVTAEGSVVADSVAGSGLVKSPTMVVTSSAQLMGYHAKALLGLWGDVVYWVGTYNIADLWIWPYTPRRDAAYVGCGLVVFLAISVYMQRQKARQHILRTRAEQRAVTTAASAAGNGERQPLTAGVRAGSTHAKPTLFGRLVTAVRIAVTMAAGIVFWVGWWNILSTYVYYGPNDYNDAGDSGDGIDSESLVHSGRFTLLSVVRQSMHLSHRFYAMQRSTMSEADFPMWILYLLYAALGVVFLLISSTLISSAGVIQPLGVIRQRTIVTLDSQLSEDGDSEDRRSFAVVEAPNGAFVFADEDRTVY